MVVLSCFIGEIICIHFFLLNEDLLSKSCQCNVQNQFPTLLRVFEAYQELPAFQDAMPEKQPDATC